MEWFVLVLKKYFVFEGRARRKEYWMYYLFMVIINIPLSIIDALIGSVSSSVDIGFLSTIFSVLTFIPWISVSVRRLHDINKSGGYMFLLFLPIIGWIWLFVLSVMAGDEGENQYGPDPKNPITELDEIGVD